MKEYSTVMKNYTASSYIPAYTVQMCLQFVAKRELQCLRVTTLCSLNNGSPW